MPIPKIIAGAVVKETAQEVAHAAMEMTQAGAPPLPPQTPPPIDMDMAVQAAAVSKELQNVLPELSRSVSSLSEQLDLTIEKFNQFSSEINQMIVDVQGATAQVGAQVEQSAFRFRETISGISQEVSGVATEFGAMGSAAVAEMGIVGRVVQGIMDRLEQMPGLGPGAGILGTFAMITLSARILEEEMNARTRRVAIAFAGLGLTFEDIGGDIRGNIDKLHQDWGMSFHEAERFTQSLAEVGRVDFGEGMGAAIGQVGESILKLHAATGLSESVITEHLRSIYRSTTMTGEGFTFATERLRDFYAWGVRSRVTFGEFFGTIMRGVEQVRFMGTEMRALPEVARFHDMFQGIFGLQFGAAGATQMFQNMMGVAGNILTDPGLFMWTFGLRGNPLQVIPREIERMMGPGGFAEGRIDPAMIFQRFIERVLPFGPDVAAGKLAMQMPGGFTPENITAAVNIMQRVIPLQEALARAINEGSEEQIAAAREQLRKGTEEASAKIRLMQDPLERISLAAEEFMRSILPRIFDVISGSLQILIDGVLFMANLFDGERRAAVAARIQDRVDRIGDAFTDTKEAIEKLSQDFREGVGAEGKGVAEFFGLDFSVPQQGQRGNMMQKIMQEEGESLQDILRRFEEERRRVYEYLTPKGIVPSDIENKGQAPGSLFRGPVIRPAPIVPPIPTSDPLSTLPSGIEVTQRIKQVTPAAITHRSGAMDILITLRAADLFQVEVAS